MKYRVRFEVGPLDTGRRDFFLAADARAFFSAIKGEKVWGELWKIDTFGDVDELLDEFGNRGIEDDE